MNNRVLVTVLMPVYNGEKYLDEAINSILNQDFLEFEFIIIDDCSADNSPKIVKRYTDPRIKFIRNRRNRGLASSLNLGLKIAKGDFVVRMDQDDISYPTRISTQLRYMLLNKDIDICGTAIKTVDEGKSVVHKQLESTELIKATLLFRNVLAHSSVIIRRKSLIKKNLYYDPNYRNAEDYDLWTRSCLRVNISNINKPLLFYRKHECQMVKQSNLSIFVEKSRKKYLRKIIGKFSLSEWKLHLSLTDKQREASIKSLLLIENWLLEIVKRNAVMGMIDKKALNIAVNTQWFNCCAEMPALGFKVIIRYFSSKLFEGRTKYRRLLTLIYIVVKKNILYA